MPNAGGSRFSLKWLLWFVTVSAFACWLLTLPWLFSSGFFVGKVVETGEEFVSAVPDHPLAEVAGRLGFCVLLLFAPAHFGHRRTAGADTNRAAPPPRDFPAAGTNS